MTIISPAPEELRDTMAARQVLAAAADVLEAYPFARLSTVNITRAVLNTADQQLPSDRSAAYRLACDALDVLAVRIGREVNRWSGVFPRVEVVAQMRAAVEQVSVVSHV